MEPIKIRQMKKGNPIRPYRPKDRTGWLRQLRIWSETFKNARTKAAGYFAVFLLLMLICTVVSRGIYAYQMPQVETGQASQKSISHMLSVSGSIAAAKQRAVVVKEGIRIKEVCVGAGEKVKKGDILLRLDLSDLKGLSARTAEEISVEEARIAAMQASSAAQAQTQQTARQRAAEDLANTRRSQDEAVLGVQGAYDASVGKLSAYPSWESYWANAQDTDSQYQDLKKAAAKEDAVKDGAAKEVQDALAAYSRELEASARTAWEQGKEALEADVAAKRQELSAANAAREDAILQAERAVRDAAQSTPSDQSGVMEAGHALDRLREQQAVYEQLLRRKGRVKSKLDGYVETVCVEAGGRTTDSAAFFLADGSRGWDFKAVLTEEMAGDIKAGDAVTIKFQNGKAQEDGCPVSAVRKLEDGGYEAVVKVKQNGLSLGEAGTMELVTQEQQYACCIPLSALYADNSKDYILLIRETNTILGKELSVAKREVKVLDKSSSYAALDASALGAEDQFVVYASKSVAPGDKVRLLEEADIQ